MPNFSGIWTVTQQMQAVGQSIWPGLPPPIGTAFGGGFYAGQISTAGNGIADYNLKPTTMVNDTSYGGNANAVPARGSNYTSGDPVQTTAAAFIVTTGAEAFATAGYWASTQGVSTETWVQLLTNGYQGDEPKTASYRVRAIRRVAV